jgi:transcriptional regulator with XRE-family HTH domain
MSEIKKESREYYALLGSHVQLLRKSRGKTQADLARELKVSQQTVFAYELGERRISIFILRKIATLFDMTLDELANFKIHAKPRNRGVSPRALRHAERFMSLPKTQQRFINKVIDAAIKANASV